MSSHRMLPVASTMLLLAATALPALAADGPTPPPDVTVRARREARVLPKHALMLDGGKRGYLGLAFLELTPELRRHFQADEKAGILVSHVDAGSPAEKAGVEVGDVLVAIDGKPVDEYWDVRQLVGPRKSGDTVTLDVVRDGRHDPIRVTVEEREGRVIELGQLMKHSAGDDDSTVLVMPSAEEWKHFGEEMGQMGEEIGASVSRAFADPQVHMKIQEHVRDREQLQRRIDELERRLRDLERKLGEQQRR